MDDIPKFVKNIKLAMQVANVSEVELRKSTHLSQTTLNQVLRGLVKAPRLDTLQVIAARLGVTLGQLVDEASLPLQNMANVKQQFAPLIEWEQVLSYIKDPNYPCLDKKLLAINMDCVEGRYFALKTTPSMEPPFRRGTIIIVESTQVVKDHQIIVVSFNGQDPALRTLIKDGSDLFLQKLNPESGEIKRKVDNSMTLLGRVVSEIRFEDNYL